ncbi:MAG: hypothetical protein ACREGF_04955, partial [Candidatus Saccharimonadales bacterium]
LSAGTALAITVIPPPGAQNNSTGLEGSISTAPPKSAPTISVPSGGQNFTTTPVTVTGLCSTQTVKIYSNNVFVGAAQCESGSYQLKVDLFSGQNDLTARQYDALGQQSPASSTVSVNFTSAQFAQFGTRVTLTSVYARIGADPGSKLVWPIILSGGKAPYAINVDWGDGSQAELLSQATIGTFSINHVYQSSGTFPVIVRATDANGTTAFLQLIGVANGKVAASSNTSTTQPVTVVKTEVLWWPFIVLIVLILLAFWMGRRQQLSSIRHELEKSRRE